MGMFGFLKKKEPPITLKVHEVEGWLKSYQDSLGLDHHFSIFLSEMRQHIKHAMERLDILADARLMNDNVDTRAKQIMEGHRKQFIKRMTDFISNIDVPKEYKKLTVFAHEFSEELEELNKDTQKNVFILREFFEKESSGVAKIIGKMDRSISDLRSTFNRLGKEKVDEAYQHVHQYHEILAKREELEKAISEEKKKLEEPLDKLDKIKKKIEDLQNSRGYHFIREAEEEMVKVKEALVRERENIRKAVTSLMKPLQKYAHKHRDKAIAPYIKHFADGLLEDEELIIAKYLGKLEHELEKLDLKPPQVEKAKKALHKITVAWLNTQKKKLVTLIKKEKELKERLGKDTTRLLLDEQYRWQQATKEHLDDLQKNVSMIENELERLSPRLHLQKIRDSLKELKDNLDLEMK